MKKAVVTMTIGILALGSLVEPAEAVKWPSSPEDVENMSDDELRAVIEEFESMWFTAYTTLWSNMGRHFDVASPSEFRVQFPSTHAYALNLYRQATATAGPSSMSAPFSEEVQDLCDDAIGDSAWGSMADAINSILLAGAVMLRDETRNEQWALALEDNLRSDFERTCPDCTDTQIDDFVELWVKETADAALLINAPHDTPMGGYSKLAIQFMLAQKCYLEACEREVAWTTFCDKYPNHLSCREVPPNDRSFPCSGGPHIPPAPPSDGGSSNSTGDVVSPGAGGAGGGSGMGRVAGRVYIEIPSGFLHPGGGEEIDVVGEQPHLPPVGGRGPVPAIPPDPGGPRCFGPCCDDRRPGGGAEEMCQIDGGMYIPCSQIPLFF